MPFAENFIAGLQAGHAHTRAQKQQEWAEEDRGIEKDILQHRIRELKIQERLQARQAAEQNLQTMQGLPTADMTPDMTEGGVLPATGVLDQPGPATRMAPIQIPGIEELGIPGISRRPQTMEQVLAQTLAAARIKDLTTSHVIPRGGILEQGGKIIAHGQDYPSPMAPFTTRDAAGVSTTTLLPQDQVVGKPQVRQPLPVHPNVTNVNVMPREESNAFVESVIAGRNGPEDVAMLPVRDRGITIGALAKRGYNMTKARQDLAATRTFFNSLNSAGQITMRENADIASNALTDLEAAANDWDAGGFGTWNAARLALAKGGAYGQEARDQAATLEGAIQNAQQAIAQIAAGGSGPVNKSLTDAAKSLSSGYSSEWLKSAIGPLKTAVGYRTGAIWGASPILPSGNLGGGGAGGSGGTGGAGGTTTPITPKAPTAKDVAARLRELKRPNDPVTVEKVMASPAAMMDLFKK